MKLALVIRGQPRNYLNGYYYLNKQIISKYDVDVFGHTWWTEKEVGKQYDTSPFVGNKIYIIQHSFLDDVKNHYNFKKFIADTPKKFISNKKYVVGLPEKHDSIVDSLLSRYFSLKSVLSLVKDYEAENDIEYDWLIISRYDIFIEKVPNLMFLNQNNIYVEDYLHSGRKFILNDNLWIIGKKHKFVFLDLFDKFDENYNKIINREFTIEQQNQIRQTELDKCSTLNGEEFMAFHLLFKNCLAYTIQSKELKYNPVRYYIR